MGLNSWALYYNKDLLAKAGIKSPPTTLAQLDADQAKEWVITNGKVQQWAFTPTRTGTASCSTRSFFGATQLLQRRRQVRL